MKSEVNDGDRKQCSRESMHCYIVRPMQIQDTHQATLIDHEAFPIQWPAIPFKRELSNSRSHYLVACREPEDSCDDAQSKTCEHDIEEMLDRPTHVAKQLLGNEPLLDDETSINRSVVGYVALCMMADEAHITSIAVQEAHRRRGVGELLVISAIDLAASLKAELVTLEVRASNYAAQTLYEKYGFCRVGERRRYYSDNKEDAIIMTTDTIASASYQKRFLELKQAYMLGRRETITLGPKQGHSEPHVS